mmetsp:Transcript_47419/g.88313  ORF Transcript_47419/g.88313 Transcript_47419/m.88313 type:complete len:317 (-) Transcript_47419:319-1269(-)
MSSSVVCRSMASRSIRHLNLPSPKVLSQSRGLYQKFEVPYARPPGNFLVPSVRQFSFIHSTISKVKADWKKFIDGGDASGTAESSGAVTRNQITSKTKRAHVFFLLDRSGSMHFIADDVIGGFNSFVEEQQKASSESAGLDMTMVQFDSEDPKQIVFADRDIEDVSQLCSKTFQPRGMTPLFDSLGGIIAMAEDAAALDKQIVIVTFSDGKENASREHSRKCIMSRVAAKQEEGWTFVFLGANQDSYAQAGQLGLSRANIQNFKFDSYGTQQAWASVSGSTSKMRSELQRMGRGMYNNKDFFDGVKAAETDYQSRS